jgi:Flp pilus assembly protein TadB
VPIKFICGNFIADLGRDCFAWFLAWLGF